MNLPAHVNSFFRLNEKQRHAIQLMGSDAQHILLYGGARSGKTFIAVRSLIARAVWSAGSRHLMARFRLAHIKASIIADTWPKVMKLCYPELDGQVIHHKTEGYFEFPNGSEVWYAGLDDKDRTEKILGLEFATVLLEECSQIPWASRELLITRLAQKTGFNNIKDANGKIASDGHVLRLKAYYAENPPMKTHWSYKVFIEKVSPDTGKRLPNPQAFAALQLNPMDNRDNIAPEFMSVLDQLSERRRKRFRDGQFGEAGEASLWTPELIEQQRWEESKELPDLLRVVVAVDPSGASNIDDAHRDEIGIVAAGLMTTGEAIVLEDSTMKGSPAEWGEAVIACCERWGADVVVGEENYGGAMVRFVVQTAAVKAKRTIRYLAVMATRGKVVRAEPMAALYEQQKVWHNVALDKLEDELCQMTTFGYTGDRSPNRADAAVWALTALFPSVIKAAKEETRSRGTPTVNLGHASMKRRR